MDTGAKKILETVTVKTLHAHGFSRSSTQANLVLTDVLSRYLTHVAQTVAKYAEHAGRHRIMVRDAAQAMDELGTSVDELKDYCATECRDIARYAAHSTKRLEDLNEFRVQLAVGLHHDDDDLIPLEWGPVPGSTLSEEEEESESDEVKTPSDEMARQDVLMIDTQDAHAVEDISIAQRPDIQLKDPLIRPPPTPPLPPSPVSRSATPPRKRPRTAGWHSPDYIPDFLPPFPTDEPQQRAASPQPTVPTNQTAVENDANGFKVERPATPPLQAQVSTVSPSADYLTVIPYSQSSLATASPRHLPQPPPEEDPLFARQQLSFVPPQTQPALLGAYHHILTHPPNARSNVVNPARYRVALALVQQSEKYNRWDAPTTLYGSTAPNTPRVLPMPPSYPVPIAKGPSPGSGAGTPEGGPKEKGEKEEDKRLPLPAAPPRTIAPPERVVPSLSRPGSRIPKLARHVLSAPVYTRTARLTHPPVLQRGTQKLTYGPGVNASWNSSFSPMPVSAPAVGKGGKDGGGGGGAANGMPNGKDKEVSRPLPDARMYATWSYEQKRFDEPLVVRRRMGSMASAVPMGRARSESTNA